MGVSARGRICGGGAALSRIFTVFTKQKMVKKYIKRAVPYLSLMLMLCTLNSISVVSFAISLWNWWRVLLIHSSADLNKANDIFPLTPNYLQDHESNNIFTRIGDQQSQGWSFTPLFQVFKLDHILTLSTFSMLSYICALYPL